MRRVDLGWAGRRARSLVALVTLPVLAACASTDMTTFSNPDYAGARYSKLLVHVGSDDLALRRQIESRAVQRLASAAASGSCAIEVFFPGRSYAAEEVDLKLREAGVDGVLVIHSADAGFTSQYVPPTYHTSTTTSGSAVSTGFASGSATRVGNSVYGSAYGTSVTTGNARSSSVTTVSGGYNVRKPWARFTVELIDVATGEVAWTGQGDSKGNAYNDFEDLWQSVADAAVRKLIEAGYLVPKQP